MVQQNLGLDRGKEIDNSLDIEMVILKIHCYCPELNFPIFI